MLDSLIALLYLVKSIVHSTLLLSWTVGQLIVVCVQTAWTPTVHFITTTVTGLTVLFEDFLIFLRDISSQIGTVLAYIVEGIESIAQSITESFNLLLTVHTNLWTAFSNGTNHLAHVLGKTWTGFTSILHLIKNTIILFGSGVWFAVTFIPLSLFYLSMSVVYLSINTIIESVNFIITFMCNVFWLAVDLCNFIIDVPVESIIGLMIGGCIAYVIIKCHTMFYFILKDWIKKMMKRIKKKLTKPPVSSPPGKNGSCIICFERNRCLVTMPCRHLCMCERCWERLESLRPVDEQTCPVCRTRVRETIRVY